MRTAAPGLWLAAALLAGPAAAQPAQPPAGDQGYGDPPYDARLRDSAAAAENFQGPLDGGWTLSAARGGDLYDLQLVDRPDRLEGAWRDLRRQGALAGSGFVDHMERAGDRLVMRFAAATVTLRARGAAWRGELETAGRRTAVVLRRTAP